MKKLTLKEIRELYRIEQTRNEIKKACALCGITFDQSRYYMDLYNLKWREYNFWDLDKLQQK